MKLINRNGTWVLTVTGFEALLSFNLTNLLNEAKRRGMITVEAITINQLPVEA